MPIVFTLRELGQHTVITAANRVILVCTVIKIEESNKKCCLHKHILG